MINKNDINQQSIYYSFLKYDKSSQMFEVCLSSGLT